MKDGDKVKNWQSFLNEKVEAPKSHMMIDIETLSVANSAVIVEIGAVVFNMETELDTRTYRPDWKVQIMKGRDISKDTVKWWNTQPFPIPDGRDEIQMIFVDMMDLAKEYDVKKFWFRGPQFDCVKLESLAEDFSCKVPWKYFDVCDCRTFDLFADPERKKEPTPHIALQDARKQVRELLAVFERIGVAI